MVLLITFQPLHGGLGEGVDHRQGLALGDGQGDGAAGLGDQGTDCQILSTAPDEQLGHNGNAQPLLHHGENGIVVFGGEFDVGVDPGVVQGAVDVVVRALQQGDERVLPQLL